MWLYWKIEYELLLITLEIPHAFTYKAVYFLEHKSIFLTTLQVCWHSGM